MARRAFRTGAGERRRRGAGGLRRRPRAAFRAGTAMTETAIVAPLYMVMLFALIFFGYSALSRQKEQIAAHYAAMQPGRQAAADMMPLFFPWNPSSLSNEARLADGSEVTAGDATLRVHEPDWVDVYNPAWNSIPPGPSGLGDTFDARRIVEYLWVMAVGQLVMTPVRLNPDGSVTPPGVREVLDYRASFLRGQKVVDPPPPAAPALNKYSAGVLFGLNCAHDPAWLARRHAALEYLYKPPFFRHVYGGEERDKSQYMTLDYPEPDFTPNYRNETRVLTRGEGRRLNTVDVGDYHPILLNVSRLLGDGAMMPDPMSDADCLSLRDSLWAADSDSIWVAK